jgi:hypothetical protein
MFPQARCEFGDAAGGMLADPLQHIDEVGCAGRCQWNWHVTINFSSDAKAAAIKMQAAVVDENI